MTRIDEPVGDSDDRCAGANGIASKNLYALTPLIGYCELNRIERHRLVRRLGTISDEGGKSAAALVIRKAASFVRVHSRLCAHFAAIRARPFFRAGVADVGLACGGIG